MIIAKDQSLFIKENSMRFLTAVGKNQPGNVYYQGENGEMVCCVL
jgi:hypothetical protein